MENSIQKDVSIDSDAFARLSEQYEPLILSLSSRYAMEGLEAEDLRQEALLALYRAAMTYREGEGVTFGLYAKVCIRNRLISILRKQKKVLPEDVLPSDGECDPEQRVLDSEARSEFLASLTALLSPLEKKVLALYLQNLSYGEIAKKLELSEKSVDNAIYRLKEKLRKRI